MPRRLISAAAVLAAMLVPAAAFGQTDVHGSPRPRYNLVQLTVKTAEITPEQFSSRTQAIRSCDDAVKLAAELGAEVTRNAYVRADEMPSQLNDILKDLPTGHATPVFSNDAAIMRVLVLCNRS